MKQYKIYAKQCLVGTKNIQEQYKTFAYSFGSHTHHIRTNHIYMQDEFESRSNQILFAHTYWHIKYLGINY